MRCLELSAVFLVLALSACSHGGTSFRDPASGGTDLVCSAHSMITGKVYNSLATDPGQGKKAVLAKCAGAEGAQTCDGAFCKALREPFSPRVVCDLVADGKSYRGSSIEVESAADATRWECIQEKTYDECLAGELTCHLVKSDARVD